MKLIVVSHKPCWVCTRSPTGVATDGGFPFQMAFLSELFDETRLVVPVSREGSRKGEMPLTGFNVSVVHLTARTGRDLSSKMSFLPWLMRNGFTIFREVWQADAIHAPGPGDVGTVGMLVAWLLRKRLFVRHCGNWLVDQTLTNRFWHRFMEQFAGGRNIMLATGAIAFRDLTQSTFVQVAEQTYRLGIV